MEREDVVNVLRRDSKLRRDVVRELAPEILYALAEVIVSQAREVERLREEVKKLRQVYAATPQGGSGNVCSVVYELERVKEIVEELRREVRELREFVEEIAILLQHYRTR